ncbi:MAG: terminase family protein [Phycisphaerae bacterium]|nr:terminase family protein [Phycisphaerae bacterium]
MKATGNRQQATAGTQGLSTALAGLLLPYQKRMVQCEERFCIWRWSRQVGKSFGASLRRIMRGMARRRNQIFLSAGMRQSRELMDKARTHLKAMQIAFESSEYDEVFEGFECRVLEAKIPAFGMRIIALPANPNTARGFTGDVLLDEFALHAHDREIFAAVYASLTRGNGELDVCSTPKGRQNWFYKLWTNDAYAKDTVTIYDAIADGLDVDADQLRAGIADDELWRQEYLCEFVDEATAFLTYEMIMACEDEKLPLELALQQQQATGNGQWAIGEDLFVGIDVGRKRDLTVIWGFEQIGSMLISAGMIELNAMPFRGQYEIISKLLESGRVRRACIDATGLGMQLAEELGERFGTYKVEPCPFTPKLKDEIAGKLRVKFMDQNIRIPASDAVRNDLHSVAKTVTAAGNVRLSAPREEGSHADRFWAAALAVHAASGDRGPIEEIPTPDLVTAGLRGRAW